MVPTAGSVPKPVSPECQCLQLGSGAGCITRSSPPGVAVLHRDPQGTLYKCPKGKPNVVVFLSKRREPGLELWLGTQLQASQLLRWGGADCCSEKSRSSNPRCCPESCSCPLLIKSNLCQWECRFSSVMLYKHDAQPSSQRGDFWPSPLGYAPAPLTSPGKRAFSVTAVTKLCPTGKPFSELPPDPPPRKQLTNRSSEVVVSASHLCFLATPQNKVQVLHC